ncbi:MAG: redoxin domain-containing protein [Candidatus Marinimicrobia bacterium]|nr:redoxin domain-containing protein [Candidatus Neomarinimicrobiota bacterium]
MPEKEVGCARPTGALVGDNAIQERAEISVKETIMLSAKVGTKAPDFEAPTYYKGDFTSVKLSNFLGKWVLLCFYPGDFTFV